MMPWLVILLGYLLGAIPTACLTGYMVRHVDICQVGDRNMGAANAYRHLGPKTGIIVGLVGFTHFIRTRHQIPHRV
ncbi:MAG: glycerol-3-phosphate acyltransferase [Dehalococcoidales bacterium]